MHMKSVRFHPDRYPTREHYPFTLDLFRQTAGLEFRTPVTLFVGENGTGKSTLLEAIARRSDIFIWRERSRTRYRLNPYEDRLWHYLSIEWGNGSVPGSFFGSAIFQDFARILDEWAATDPGQLDYFGGQSLLTQSHGQSIMSFFRARYALKGLYLLDEPETALSPRTQLALLDLWEKMSADGHAQFIVATHSPILLSCPGATIYSFDQAPITPISYQQTDHYKTYKIFMDNQEGKHR
jgi:predicted ATPase